MARSSLPRASLLGEPSFAGMEARDGAHVHRAQSAGELQPLRRLPKTLKLASCKRRAGPYLTGDGRRRLAWDGWDRACTGMWEVGGSPRQGARGSSASEKESLACALVFAWHGAWEKGGHDAFAATSGVDRAQRSWPAPSYALDGLASGGLMDARGRGVGSIARRFSLGRALARPSW